MEEDADGEIEEMRDKYEGRLGQERCAGACDSAARGQQSEGGGACFGPRAARIPLVVCLVGLRSRRPPSLRHGARIHLAPQGVCAAPQRRERDHAQEVPGAA